ncbi:nitrate reductase cytochrome c-type subunit [Endozoicomonas arenosclerae]|uniref:nitrate reductase cytochrome c-type subunit n=1 Tax=Endozoicomonas arenosclerae TaxID=1633495 RepID=UPI0007836424|nr:nitrate reductase cytochrome c-type subunit [Endozoicomonas arenosclerae]
MKRRTVSLLWLPASVAIVYLASIAVLQGADNQPPPEDVESLRGSEPVGEVPAAPELKKYPKERVPMDLQYVGQPPLIPHSIRGYEITANSNKCLTCHALENAKSARAPGIGISHYRGRDGKILADVSPSRYFCTQCHVPQANAKPLVPNTYEPVESLKKP